MAEHELAMILRQIRRTATGGISDRELPRSLLEVPGNAVRRDKGHHYVLVITDQNRLEKRSIKIGSFEGQGLVEEGLRADDWVVIGDVKDLQAGERVQPERVTATKGSTPGKD